MVARGTAGTVTDSSLVVCQALNLGCHRNIVTRSVSEGCPRLPLRPRLRFGLPSLHPTRILRLDGAQGQE